MSSRIIGGVILFALLVPCVAAMADAVEEVPAAKASLLEQVSWAPPLSLGKDERMKDFDLLPAAQAKAVAYMADCDVMLAIDACEQQFGKVLSVALPKKWTADYTNLADLYDGSGVDLAFDRRVDYAAPVSMLASRIPPVAVGDPNILGPKLRIEDIIQASYTP